MLLGGEDSQKKNSFITYIMVTTTETDYNLPLGKKNLDVGLKIYLSGNHIINLDRGGGCIGLLASLHHNQLVELFLKTA